MTDFQFIKTIVYKTEPVKKSIITRFIEWIGVGTDEGSLPQGIIMQHDGWQDIESEKNKTAEHKEFPIDITGLEQALGQFGPSSGDNNPLFKLVKTIKDAGEKPTKLREEIEKERRKDDEATWERDENGYPVRTK